MPEPRAARRSQLGCAALRFWGRAFTPRGIWRILKAPKQKNARGKRVWTVSYTHLVVNNGPAIDPEVLPRIFNTGFTTKAAGHGLGLSIVKELVEDLSLIHI